MTELNRKLYEAFQKAVELISDVMGVDVGVAADMLRADAESTELKSIFYDRDEAKRIIAEHLEEIS